MESDNWRDWAMKAGLKIAQGNKYGLNYRFVEEEDAEFITKLRTDEKLAQFLHPIDGGVAKQIEWIRKYKEREALETDFYFLFEDSDGNKLGVARLYNINELDFTYGSWIFSLEAPIGASILGDIIVREIGFEELGLDACFFDVRKANKNVLKYHQNYSPVLINDDDLNYYFRLDKFTFNKGKEKLLKLIKKSL